MEDIKKIQEFFSKPLEENKVTKEDFDKVVKVLSASKYPFTIMLVPKWGEIDIITGQDSPDEIVDDITQRLDSAGLNWGGNSGITISGDSSNYSRREYSDIFRVKGGHKDYFEESVNEDNSYVKVSKPRFKFDKNHGNFLNVYMDYDIGPGGASVALGKETMTGQIRRLSSAEAVRQMNDIAKKLQSDFNVEDIEVTDLKNGKVRIFAVSDDFAGLDSDDLNRFYSVNEDMNDPVLMRMRAEKDKLAKMRAANAGDDGNDKFFDNAKKIAFLKKERAQLMRDMEQEAEPEGGPIADEYGAKLNRIDAAIAKLSGRKEMTYDQAIAENDSYSINDFVRMVKDDMMAGSSPDEMPSDKQVASRAKAYYNDYLQGASVDDLFEATKEEENEFHTKLDKLVHKTFGHSSDEKKKSIAQELAETIKLGEGVIEEELCPKGKAYIKRRKAAGEKSSAYLSGRAVKVCKGQMSGRKKKK